MPLLGAHQSKNAAGAPRPLHDLERGRDRGERLSVGADRDWRGWRGRICSQPCMPEWHGNGGSNRNACPASVPTPSEPQPTTSRCAERKCTKSGSGPGTWAPSSFMFKNAAGSDRFDQSVRIRTQEPASIRPCLDSQPSTYFGVSRKSGLAATSFETSMTHAGAMKRSTEIVSVALLIEIFAGDPVNRRVEVRAGVFAAGKVVPVPRRATIVVFGDLLETERPRLSELGR